MRLWKVVLTTVDHVRRHKTYADPVEEVEAPDSWTAAKVGRVVHGQQWGDADRDHFALVLGYGSEEGEE